MKIRYWSYRPKFRYPFTISKGSKTHQPTLVVELEHMGFRGYGEAPAITYYHISTEKMVADLEAKKNLVEKFAFTDPERFWHYLHHAFPENPFLVCALDIAGWDLYGKMKRKPLSECWNLDSDAGPFTDYTIGIDTAGKMLEKMKEKPWPIYKIKLGTREDTRIVKSLREYTDAIIRVDANGGWDTQEALEKIPQLEALGVELIEQPLAKDNWKGMKILYSRSSLPLFADESCVPESDVERCAGYFHGINIKLTKCSGLTPARRMIHRARELGMQVMVGSMNETTVGSAAIANLLPLLDHADLDGPLLLEDDIAEGLQYNYGKVTLSGRPGLGIEFFGMKQPVTE